MKKIIGPLVFVCIIILTIVWSVISEIASTPF